MEIKRMGSRELRDNLASRVDAAHFRHEPTVVTHNGEPRAVLISYEEWLRSQEAGVRPPSPPGLKAGAQRTVR